MAMAPMQKTREVLTKASVKLEEEEPFGSLDLTQSPRFSILCSRSRHSPMAAPIAMQMTTTNVSLVSKVVPDTFISPLIAPVTPTKTTQRPTALEIVVCSRLGMPFFNKSPIPLPIRIAAIFTSVPKPVICKTSQYLNVF